jgi:hypothetical protein
MATIVTRSHVPWAQLPTLARMTLQETENAAVYKEIVDIKDSSFSPDKTKVTTASVTSIGPLQRWGETLAIPFDTPNPGFVKTTAYADFGLAVAFSRNAQEDELYGIYPRVAKGLGRARELFRNLNIARLLDNAENTTYFTAENGEALLSTAHPAAGVPGLSRPNRLGTGSALSYSTLVDLIVLGWSHVDDNGYPAPAWKDGDTLVLVVAPSDVMVATKLVNELTTHEPGNANNDVNPLRVHNKFRIVVNPYMTEVGATQGWFLIPGGEKSIYIVERRPMEASNYKDNATKAMIYDVTCREAVHVENPWSLWGGGYDA